jgi:hypothetical protein
MFLRYLCILLIETPCIATTGALLHNINPIIEAFNNRSEIEYPHSRQVATLRDAPIPALGLAKSQAETAGQWVQTSKTLFNYLTATNQWTFDSRDTTLFNTEGRLISNRTTSANVGWDLKGITQSDSAVWDGPRRSSNISAV